MQSLHYIILLQFTMSGKIDEIEDTKKEDSKASDPKMDGAGAKDPKLGSTAKGNLEPADKGNTR